MRDSIEVPVRNRATLVPFGRDWLDRNGMVDGILGVGVVDGRGETDKGDEMVNRVNVGNEIIVVNRVNEVNKINEANKVKGVEIQITEYEEEIISRGNPTSDLTNRSQQLDT